MDDEDFAFLSPDCRGIYTKYGMSLRDYFAAKAMQAYLTGHISFYGHENYWAPGAISSEAYGVADAMLAARGKS